MSRHDLFDFMRSVTDQMSSEYKRVQRHVIRDPGTAGDQIEENWANLLRQWLPPLFKVVTKGCIINTEGDKSNQIDIIVLNPGYPKFLYDKKMYLAGGVSAAFECKMTVKVAHIREAIEHASIIQRLFRPRTGTPYRELYGPPIFGLLAHSHSWRSCIDKNIERIDNSLFELDKMYVRHPREMIDFICISDLGFWHSTKLPFTKPQWSPAFNKGDANLDRALIDLYGVDGSSSSGYACAWSKREGQHPEYSPIGSMLSHIYRRLGWEHPLLREISDYFRIVGMDGCSGAKLRSWDADIFSDSIRNLVTNGMLSNGHNWHEWSMAFP